MICGADNHSVSLDVRHCNRNVNTVLLEDSKLLSVVYCRFEIEWYNILRFLKMFPGDPKRDESNSLSAIEGPSCWLRLLGKEYWNPYWTFWS